MNKTAIAAAAFLVSTLSNAGCDHSHRRRRVPANANGTFAGDFQSLADYLDDPAVDFLLRNMPRNRGSSPPNVEGEFASDGEVVRDTIRGTSRGDPVTGSFCFGSPAGGRLEVIVQDPSVVDAGASSFVEGSGDDFTVYTAFKSVQNQDNGATCEIHEVNIFAGERNSDGSLSNLSIGQAITGLVGECGSLSIGDIQVSENSADRVGASCTEDPGAGPGDPSNVLVEVQNELVTDVLVFLGDDTTPTLEVPALSNGTFEAVPGFALAFESVQPSAGDDGLGNELLMGEIVAGLFGADNTPAGESVAYALENQVGADVYFAPLPLNRTEADIYSVVNTGVDLPGYPDPAGSGLDCLCSMAPSLDPYVVGYYSYSLPGVIAPNQTNVRFFDAATDVEVDSFTGPFVLGSGSGTVTLLVD